MIFPRQGVLQDHIAANTDNYERKAFNLSADQGDGA